MTTPISKGFQCKDIDDVLFLKAVEMVAWARDRPYATLWDVQVYLTKAMWKEFGDGSTGMAEPERGEDVLSVKVIRNKARKLIRRGLLTGCYCGCRGEWELTDLMVISGAPTSVVYRRDVGAPSKTGRVEVNRQLRFLSGAQIEHHAVRPVGDQSSSIDRLLESLKEAGYEPDIPPLGWK